MLCVSAIIKKSTVFALLYDIHTYRGKRYSYDNIQKIEFWIQMGHEQQQQKFTAAVATPMQGQEGSPPKHDVGNYMGQQTQFPKGGIPSSSSSSSSSSSNNQLSSVYSLLQTPDSAAQLQLWKYQLPSPQFTQSAYSYHDSAQKAAVDRAGRFGQGPLPWRNVVLPPDGSTPASTAVVTTPGAHFAPAVSSIPTGAGGAPTTANDTGFRSFPSESRRNTQEAVARGIAERHKDRPISEYATVVKQAELAVLNMDPQTHSKTLVQTAEQNRERERQVYALLWLMKSCRAQTDSYVPRGRIFAQYAASCAQNGLKPLSQASLGKLIRAVFPDLTTRRLGMRGQSRYHYCGLKLVDPSENAPEADSPMQMNMFPQHSPQMTASSFLPLQQQQQQQQQQSQYQRQPQPQPQLQPQPQYRHQQQQQPHVFPPSSENYYRAKPNVVGLEPLTTDRDRNDYEIPFMENIYENVFSNEISIPSDYALKFPKIPRSQLPPGTDEDIVSALESLYHVHCNTIFEHIRFMKFGQLQNCLVLFGSGSISPQMYSLFTNESLHHWVYQCDLITHVSLIKCLSRMVPDFNNVPASSINKLEEFAKAYDEVMSESTIDLPIAMVSQKAEIVKSFSRLVRKLVQLIKYLRESSKTLLNFQNMSKDWLSYENLDDVLYVINRNGYEKVVPLIRYFMSVDVTRFVDELATGVVRFDSFVRHYCEAISAARDVPAYKVMECIMMFSKVFMADINIEMQQNGYPWYVLDMLFNLLTGYCYEVNRFI